MNTTPLPTLEFHLLGTPQISRNGLVSTVLTAAKARALLYYLAMTASSHRPTQPRALLAALLWGEGSDADARGNLRKAIQQLSTHFGAYLSIDHHTVGLRADQPYAVDAIDFVTAIAHPRTAQLDSLQQAIALYQGDFLEGFYIREAPDFETWMLGERARLRALMLQGVEILAMRYADQGDLLQAIATARRLLDLEPWREETHRQVMEWLAQAGQRSAALAQYEICRRALTEELAVEPSHATRELYARLLRQEITEPPALSRSAVTEYTLVGRRQEWQTLCATWSKVLQTGMHFVCIAGEAGIGKSRLAEELLTYVQYQGYATLRARCYALEGRLAYGPVADWLRSAPLRPHLTKLNPVWLGEVARLLPELLVEHAALPPPQPLTERWQQKRFFDALVQAFTLDHRPCLLVLDDLQWCDPETLEWLHYWLGATPQANLLVVGTMRNDEMDEDHPLYKLGRQLRREEKLTILELAPLSVAETAALGAQVANQHLDAYATAWLCRETAGNPLFVIECVRAGLRQEDEIDTFAVAALPPKVYGVIQARLAQLSAEAHALAQLAATVGRAFTVALLVQAGLQDEETVVRGLDELWRRRLVREQEPGWYDFSHDRMRDVAYAEVSPIRRRLFHQRVAETLAVVYAANLDLVSGQVAAQYELAGALAPAVDYYQQAAGVARRLYANQEAVHYLQKGLALLNKLPDTPAHRQQELETQVALASVLMDTQGWASLAVEQAYARAFALSRQVEKTAQLFPILWGLHEVYLFQAKHEPAFTMSEQCMELAQRVQDPALLLQAHHAIAGVCALLAPDKMKLALAHAEEAITLYNPEQHHVHTFHYGGHDPGVCCLQLAARLLWMLGHPDQAQRRAEAALHLARQLSHPYTWAFAFNNVAAIYVFLCKPDRVTELTTTAIAIATERDFPQQVAQGLILRGWSFVMQGEVEQGIGELRQGVALWKTLGVVLHLSYFPLLFAEAYAKAGQLEDGLAALDEALAAATTHNDRYWEAEIHRLRGELSLAVGKSTAEAETAFQQALTIARRQQAKSLELRATVSLSRLWQQQGRIEEAQQLLSAIYHWFTEGFDTVDLREAKALLDELQVAQPS